MRLAIQDSWPNLPVNAEREFIKRFQIACENIGVECGVVVTSDDILAFEPSAVLVSHEFSRKLTAAPTIGMIWSPLSFFRNDPYRVKSLLSFDGYLAGNSQIQTYLKDLQFGVSARKPIAKELFLPTSYCTDHLALEDSNDLSLSYVGVHWDGTRHRELFDELIRRDMITCYGPEKSWKHISNAYGGFLPIDGRSVIEAIASHGIALCLHKAEHRAENTPSMRLFEALSVGALPICDEIGFARDHLSDFVEFIDFNQGSDVVAQKISGIIEETRRSPERAIARAKLAKQWFDGNWSLEHKIEKVIIPLVEQVQVVGRFSASAKPHRRTKSADAIPSATYSPDCEVVIRTGGRSLDYLERAVRSVKAANSAEFKLGVILVDYRGEKETVDAAQRLAETDFPIRYIRSAPTGFRSTALWDGINAVKAPFVAHMDDDDTVFKNHYRQLSDGFAQKPDLNVFYSGVIKVEDEPGYYTKAPNFDGPLENLIEERRDLHFLEAFDVRSLAKFVNFIQSNTWMARTDFIQEMIGEDPELIVVEDIYLYLLLATAGPFGFTGSPTAQWHWRSETNDNSMLQIKPAVWDANIARIRLRLARLKFKTELGFDELTAALAAGESPADIDKRTPDMLAPLNFNHGIEGGSEFKNRTIRRGFHPPEGDGMGVWSKDYSATVLFALGEGVREQGGKLAIEFIGSMNDAYDRWLELGLEGGAYTRVAVTDWSMKMIEIPLPAGLESPVVLKVTSSHLVEATDAHGTRQLGAFLRSIRALPDDGSNLRADTVAGVVNVDQSPSFWARSVALFWRRLIGMDRSPRAATPQLRRSEKIENDLRKPEDLKPLYFNHRVEGGAALQEQVIFRGFHRPEGDGAGVWSGLNSASLQFGLSGDVREDGGTLVIDYVGAAGEMADRWIEFGIEGEDHVRVQVPDWSSKTLELPLRTGLPHTILLKITSSHLIDVMNSVDRRELGCFISSIRVVAHAHPGATTRVVAELDKGVPVSRGLAIGESL